MKKICLIIQYNGKNFCGWQKQIGKRTVQGVLEHKISKLLKEEISLFASGRTDAGVHATGQTAHFGTNSKFDLSKLPFAVNSGLENDVSILKAKEVSQNFHARYSVKKKTYIYKIYVSKIKKPLKNGLVTQVIYDLDISKMKQATKYFVGEHNFFAFCSSGSSVKDFVRIIYDFKIKKVDDEIHLKISGNGFLYNMVRIIVGTLIDIGRGKIKPEEIVNIIKSKDRKKAGETMPAHGLYLCKVSY